LLGVAEGVACVIQRARGCPACAYRGYRGRLALTEILQFDDELDELLLRGASRRVMLEAARDRGFTTLAEDGVRRVRDGSTSIEELCRVIAIAPER
jgi:general secretion pathway protein E/type IV pilus assembly protein PilB